MNNIVELIGNLPFLAVLFTIIIAIALLALYIIGTWKIFEKAGESGWKSLIPFYNSYILFNLFWETKYFWISFLLEMVTLFLGFVPLLSVITSSCMTASLVSTIFLNYKISKAFGHDIGYCIGLTCLPFVFTLILGFGSDEVIN